MLPMQTKRRRIGFKACVPFDLGFSLDSGCLDAPRRNSEGGVVAALLRDYLRRAYGMKVKVMLILNSPRGAPDASVSVSKPRAPA